MRSLNFSETQTESSESKYINVMTGTNKTY